MHITYYTFIASAIPRAKHTGPNLSEHREIIIIGSVCLCRAVLYTMSDAFELKINSEKEKEERTNGTKNGSQCQQTISVSESLSTLYRFELGKFHSIYYYQQTRTEQDFALLVFCVFFLGGGGSAATKATAEL